MKIRKGFVSNSSSSSFCIFGADIDDDKLIEILKQRGTEVSLDDKDKAEILSNELEKIVKELGSGYSSVYSWEGEHGLIGKDLSSMKQSETRREFESGIKQKFKETGLPKPSFILREVRH